MTNRKIKLISLFLLIGACSDDFLETTPKGELSSNVIENSEEGIEGLLIAAYSILNGQYDNSNVAYNSPASNWTFGDVVSDDAYKGSSGISDQSGIHSMEIFTADANVRDVQRKWEALYEGVVRCNTAIRNIRNFAAFTEEKRELRIAEARFLRGHYYFDLKKIYNKIPYFREQATAAELSVITNTEYTSQQLWNFIEEDFESAAVVLPDVQEQVGRATSGAAYAYLAKAHLYQQEWQEAVAATTMVMNSAAGYNLQTNFHDIYDPTMENGVESVFSIQYSINDGADRNGINGGVGDRLSMVGGPYPRQYGFHMPSQNLVNFFKTGANGLPLLSSFNNSNLSSTDNVDPRLDFTVGRDGISFINAGIFRPSWMRGNATYGDFGKKKYQAPINEAYLILTNPYTNTINYYLIRYADVLLFRAEALIELNQLEEARELINRIRRRARDGAKVMTEDGSTEAANYLINEYTDPWTNQEVARQALRAERRLELAMEGHRFFDLVRWEIAENTMNGYFEIERNRRPYMNDAQFMSGKHEYFPIPQSERDISEGRLEQNNGYQ